MLKIDISSAIPRRLWTYLLGIIPGLLFELSLAFGEPRLAQSMIDRVKQIYPFQPYALLVLFVGSCLVVGQTFFLVTWFAELLMGSVYRFKRYFIRVTFGSDWLYRILGRLQGVPPRRTIFIRCLSRLVFWGRGYRIQFDIRPVLDCYRSAARQLLIRRYGIIPRTALADPEWQVWPSILGKPPASVRETLLTMRTFLGSGIAGLSALYIVPALRNRYFVAVAVVFIVFGCAQCWSFAKMWHDPVRLNLARLMAVLAELGDTITGTKKEDSRPDKANVLIDSDAEERG